MTKTNTQQNTQQSAEKWEEQTCNTVDAIFQSHLLNENPQAREMFLDTIRPLLTHHTERGAEAEKGTNIAIIRKHLEHAEEKYVHDTEAHKHGRCSYPFPSTCSAEEYKFKQGIKELGEVLRHNIEMDIQNTHN